jgi:copper chaperone CopZ
MKSIPKILITIFVLLSGVACKAQIKNASSETVKIYGNCEMCETTIEKAGNIKKIAEVDWNEETKMATLTFDSKKTNRDEILKRIALAGYDSDSFLAPLDTYSQLPSCCQYERKAKLKETKESTTTSVSKTDMHDHAAIPEQKQEVQQLKAVFDNYFGLKDALVKTDGGIASSKANSLLSAIGAVKMEKLTTEEHTVWMKVVKDLGIDAEHIADTKDPSHQREHFIPLSKNMYQLIKVSKQSSPVYYQFCPMANDGKGANWLSKENSVKNPYYGSMMLTCGSTIETIK